MFSNIEITGQMLTHVVQNIKPSFAAHPEVVETYLDMRSEAALAGFDLVIFSSFRDFKT
ncbi:MAG: hypothetical protein MK188_05955 [Gammaproteobacteria bacterium]|nr:hypothetical protein [Gammaproteobacteria bacterium]